MSITADLLGAAQRDRDRYREALTTIQDAACYLPEAGPASVAVLLNPEGDLDWSAVHTFVTDVVDLGMTAEAALADLADAPPGALQVPIQGMSAAPVVFIDDPGVPEQPHRE